MSDVLSALPEPEADDAETSVYDNDREAKPDMALADQLMAWIRMANIADDLRDDERSRIAQKVLLEYQMDEESRSEWKDQYDKWLNFAMQVAEQKTYPWPGASNIIYPLITTAAIQFNARAYPAIIRDKDVVKGTIAGPDDGTPQLDPRTGMPMQGPDGSPVWAVPPGAKKAMAEKIGEHMSWQLLEEQEEWEPQTDTMLLVLPIVGTMFRKSYFDPGMQRNVSETVDASRICVNFKAKSFETAPRVSEIVELYPWEVETAIRSGVFLDEDYGQDFASGPDDDAPITFIEQHRRYDLDGDGYPEPYIVTVAKDSGKMARMKAAYDESGVFFSKKDHKVRKIVPISYYTKYGFIPNPSSRVYDIGFGTLLYPINDGINSTLNQLFDAGHLANTGGGFYGAALSMNAGSLRFQIGELKPVNTSGGTIRDNIYMMEWPGPSPITFQLLQFLVEAGKEIAAVKDVMVGDLPGDNTSGVATLAMIEQGLKVFSAIYKRIHRALKYEFKKLFELNRKYLPMQDGYRRGNEWKTISQRDYEQHTGVSPVSDPQMVTDMQKLGRAQYLGQFKDDPWFDGREVRKRMLDASLFSDVESLLKQQIPPNPVLIAKTAELDLKRQEQDLRRVEVGMKAAHEEADLAIRRGKDKASEVLILAQAMNALAQARKADAEVNQGWYDAQLAFFKTQVEAMNAGTDSGPASDNPAAIAGLGGPSAGAQPSNGAGAQPAAVQPVAPSSGDAGGSVLPGGLPQGVGGGGVGQLA